ncbi:MFS transporter [Actinomadura vinacea]|uniref:MFS transporter n=1 Tax=Actinomadura vinacea TaxID=115336 RepID=A0ABN3IPH6_9ACTN
MSSDKHTTPAPMGRIAFASMIGTMVEWYDMFLFALCTSVVFPHLFFPEGNEGAANIQSFAVFGVAFLARPLGGAVFGHFGDRFGRKTSLVATLLLMGLATLGIGLLPGYATLGIAAPLILCVFRLCQGFGLGGEWGGAVLIAVEHAPPGRRGFYGLFPQVGNPLGFFLANAILQAIVWIMGEEAFIDWGWRIAFYIGGAFILLGLYVRTRIMDAEVFLAAKAEPETRKFPLALLFRRHWKVLLLTIVMQAPFAVSAYALNSYFGTYLTQELDKPTSWVLIAGMVGSLLSVPAYIGFSLLSDRIGRKPVYAIGIGGWLVLAGPFYWLVSTGTLWGVVTAVSLGWVLGHAGCFAVQSSYLSELFTTEVRYSGTSMSYQLAAVVWGGPAGMIAAALFAATGSVYSISAYVAISCLLGLLVLSRLPETFRSSLGPAPSAEKLAGTGTAA